MGPLPTTKSNNKHILVAIDHFSKWAEFFALPNQEARTVANCLVLVFCRHGGFEQLHSDQGKNYQSNLIKEFCEILDIHQTRTTAFHAMGDGMSERMNKTLQRMIACYVDKNQTNWDEQLPFLAFAYNTSEQASTGRTPFEIIYGRLAKVPIDLTYQNKDVDLSLDPNGYAVMVKNKLQNVYEHVNTNRDVAVNKQKLYYDRTHRAAKLNVGDRVWLHDSTKKIGLSKKFSKNWIGPYTVISKIGDANYTIQHDLPKKRKITVHANRLKKCLLSKDDYTTLNQSNIQNKSGVDQTNTVEHTKKQTQRRAKRGNAQQTDNTHTLEDVNLFHDDLNDIDQQNDSNLSDREHNVTNETITQNENDYEEDEYATSLLALPDETHTQKIIDMCDDLLDNLQDEYRPNAYYQQKINRELDKNESSPIASRLRSKKDK